MAKQAENQIELSWQGGRLNLPVKFSESDIGETVRLLQGSRLITDWESRYPSAEALAPLEKRKQSRVAARLLELSQTYGLASREMSLVAVVTRAGDRPGELPETRVVPVGMAQDTAFGAYFRQFSPDGFSGCFSPDALRDVALLTSVLRDVSKGGQTLHWTGRARAVMQRLLFGRSSRAEPAECASARPPPEGVVLQAKGGSERIRRHGPPRRDSRGHPARSRLAHGF